MGRLDDLIQKLGGDKINAIDTKTHSDFSECDTIYKSELVSEEGPSLALFLGMVPGKDKILLGFGYERPFVMTERQFLYFSQAHVRLGDEMYKDKKGYSFREAHKKNAKTEERVEMTLGKGDMPKKRSLEDLQELINESGKVKETLENTEDVETEAYEEAKKAAEDMQEIFDSLSEEEKNALSKDIAKQQEEMLYEQAKALEKDLMGELEEEPKIEYDYHYFKKIREEKGNEVLREELAKIPKEERKAMINKIVEEAKNEAEGD